MNDSGVNRHWLAGVAEARITPPVGVPLLGVAGAPSEGVHDDLYARALVIGDGRSRVAVVSLDLVGLDFATSDEIRRVVSCRTGIKATLVCCSHTHSAPFTMPWSVQGWEGFRRDWAPWHEEMKAAVVAAIERAAGGTRAVELRAGRGAVQIGMNRRLMTDQVMGIGPNPHGPVVPWVDVLRIEGLDGEPLAVVYEHAAHAVAVHGASAMIGADYPGYASGQIRRRLGETVVPMFLQGCSGNINVGVVDGGFEVAERKGAQLGEAVAAAESERVPVGRLTVAMKELVLPMQDIPSPEACRAMLEETRRQLAEAESAGASAPRLWSLRDYALSLEDLLAKSRRGGREELRFDIHCVSLGDRWGLLAMPHEVFAEYQLWAEGASPYRRTMVAAYVNACESYVPTDAELALGGYEAAAAPRLGAALRYHHRSAVAPGVEGRIKKAITELWDARQ